MRKNAKSIVMTIVISFGISLFAGILFYKSLEDSVVRKQVDPKENAIAELGTLFVNKFSFAQNLQKYLSAQNIQQEQLLSQDPAFIEYVYSLAWQDSLKDAVLLDRARKSDLKLAKKEKAAIMDTLLAEAGYESLKALKKQMKTNGLNKQEIDSRLENYIVTQSLMSRLKAQNHLNEGDLSHVNKSVNLDLLIIPNNPKLDANATQERVQKIQKELLSGKTIEALQKVYPDLRTRFLSWKSFFDLEPAYRQIVFNLNAKEWSNPIVLENEQHLINVLEIKESKNKLELQEGKELETVQNLLINQQVERWTVESTQNKDVIFYDPILDVLYSKMKSDKNLIALKYEKLISMYPSVPAFYLSLARFYASQNKSAKALEWYEKADVVSDLDVSLALPQVNIELGELLKEKKQLKAANLQFDRAISRAQFKHHYEYLEQFFEKIKDSLRLKQVKSAIEEMNKVQAAQTNP